jgi:DNA polymerase III subunit delta
MTLAELYVSIKKKQFDPLYLFHGNEDLLIEEGMDAIIENAISPELRGFNLDIMDGGKVDAKDVVAHASAFPMMSERRVVVVKECERLVQSDTAKEVLAAYIHRPLESTSLIMIAGQADFRRKPFTDLKKRAVVIECKPLYDNEVPRWVMQRIEKGGKSADMEACRLLHAYTGNALRVVKSEIEKLFTFVGDKSSITQEDVAAVVGVSKGYSIFDLQNAVGAKDHKSATKILARMLQHGENPQYIIVMLTRFFKQLWKLHAVRQERIPDTQLAGAIGVNPYFVKQYLGFQSNFTQDAIASCFRALLEADVVLKTTSRKPQVVLDVLLYSLVRGSVGEYANISEIH